MRTHLGAEVRRSRSSVAYFTLVCLLLSLSGLVDAQQRHNFLAIDDELVEEAGPYYFIEYGDSGNAYAKAAPFADALGLNLAFDEGRKVLVFNDGRTRVEWDTTTDVAAGLQREMDVLRVDGTSFGRAVPRGIVVNGTSYVAVTPLVESFGGEHGWHDEARVITVDTAPPATAAAASAGAEAQLSAPRMGLHDGFTRVAIDVPTGQVAEVLVSDGTVALHFPRASIAAVDRVVEEGPLTRYYASDVDGGAALVLMVEHAVAADGTGYRLGRTADDVVYVDVGPGLAGDPAAGAAPEARAPPVPTPVAAAPSTPRRQVVVIDAGHGGHDPGTVSAWAQEKAIVLPVASRLAALLEAEGIEVILTRDSDEFLELRERATYATTDRNVFVSIHANAASNPSANGIETWVFGQPLDPTLIERAIRENGRGAEGERLTQEAAASLDIASDILSETQLNYSLSLANRVQDRLIASTGARDRGVRQNLFYVIRNARIPAVLVELGFVSHSEEGRRLTQDHYQQTLADALADGILDFLRGGGELALH